MRLLIFNHYAGSPQHGMEYRPYYMAREWQKAGHQVTIVASTESHVRTRQVHVRGAVTEQIIDGIRYVWLRTPKYRDNGARRALNMAAFVTQGIRHAQTILNGGKADVVIASSTYPLDIIPARRIARLSGAKLIFEVHDLWPLSPIELGGMKRSHPFIVLMQWAENLAYRSADRVVSLLPNTLEHMRQHGMPPQKFLYVPNGVDREAWLKSQAPIPVEHAKVLDNLKQNGRFVVGYAGAHGLANALETVLDAASLLSDEPVTFVLVGQGPERDKLMTSASARGLENVVLLPPVERAAVPQLLARLDAAYLGWRRQPLYRFGISPNKLIDYMMAGVPVIHAVEAANDPVAEAGCGFSIPPEDGFSLAEAVIRMSKLPASERFAMGDRGKEFILKHQTYDVLAKRFMDGILELMKEA